MKILHIIPSLAWERGGPSAVVRALARHQVEAGHHVCILTTDQGVRHGQKPMAMGSAVEVRQLRVLGPDRLAYSGGFSAAARDAMRDAQVVHAHSIFTYPIHAALREGRALGIPTVLRPCGQLHRYSLQRSRWQKWVYLKVWGKMVRASCWAWHYTSDNEANNSWPWEASPRFVLANGVEPAEYAVDREEAKAAVAARWGRLGDWPYVLFLGRLHPKKRLDLLIQAFLDGAPARMKLVIAGPDEDQLWGRVAARFIRTPAASQRIVRLDTVTGMDKAHLLAAATLFALPSEHENFGVAALEALAAGTPVAISPYVDLAEAAAPDGIMFTVPLEAHRWRELFASRLTDPGALERCAPLARNWARENYSWSYLARELTRHYEEIISDRASGRSTAPATSGVPAAVTGAGND